MKTLNKWVLFGLKSDFVKFFPDNGWGHHVSTNETFKNKYEKKDSYFFNDMKSEFILIKSFKTKKELLSFKEDIYRKMYFIAGSKMAQRKDNKPTIVGFSIFCKKDSSFFPKKVL